MILLGKKKKKRYCTIKSKFCSITFANLVTEQVKKPQSGSITKYTPSQRLQNSAGTFLKGLFLARSKEEKHIRGMKQQTHLHPPERKSPPFGIHELYSYPQTLRPSPCTQKRAMFLKMLVALQWPQNYSQGQSVWIPVSHLIHSLIS